VGGSCVCYDGGREDEVIWGVQSREAVGGTDADVDD